MELKNIYFHYFLLLLIGFPVFVDGQLKPDEINFTRQAVRRFVFEDDYSVPLAKMNPREIIGMGSMHPTTHHLEAHAQLNLEKGLLSIGSDSLSNTTIWLSGFNPFATYVLDVDSCGGQGTMGFKFSDQQDEEQISVAIHYEQGRVQDVSLSCVKNGKIVFHESILLDNVSNIPIDGRLILQMLGSGLNVYIDSEKLPVPIAQADFSDIIDLRAKKYLHNFQSELLFQIDHGSVSIHGASVALSAGMGLADIRVITYEDGSPLLDQDRLWYTMTIRGRGLPHNLQGVFSLNPTVFDLRFEGVIVFDKNDGILRNEVASHIFYDRKEKLWRGLTTGFSAYANKEEHKQLLAIESTKDPRFGFSVMKASPFGMVGDIEDPHILYDKRDEKWRILACENIDGYKAVLMESENWNNGYHRISGPVKHNSTGTSIQRLGGVPFCFSGSDERKIFIYSYPELAEIGTLKLDLPPWDNESGTRVWPNVVEMPPGYPFRFVALMMDRFNFPGIKQPNWTYGALYLYHGYLKE